MLKVDILCVGKLKEAYLKDALDEYKKRLAPLCRFCVTEVSEERVPDNPSQAQLSAAMIAEGERILSKISPSDYVIASCIEGRNISSEELSKKLSSVSLTHSSVVFVIGGSWGLSDKVKSRADFLLSMGKMTFPHQLFRVMLSEQIYRAFQIEKGTKYHK